VTAFISSYSPMVAFAVRGHWTIPQRPGVSMESWDYLFPFAAPPKTFHVPNKRSAAAVVFGKAVEILKAGRALWTCCC